MCNGHGTVLGGGGISMSKRSILNTYGGVEVTSTL
jgi:hypothetical protein